MNQTLRHFLVIAVVCAVVSRAEAGGVTLITHGFNSDVASWIIPMQGRVAHYGDLTPANTTCYEITITQNGSGQYVAAANLLSGTNPVFAASGEILIKLNWSTLSGLGGASTTVIATTAANALLDTNLIPALGGRTLVEGPLHLVGHSRGASVIAEMSRLLGAQGLWVDQLTTLDPYPVSGFGDPAMKLYSNVLYWDNYWQNQNVFLDPQGQALTGAYNRKLTNLSGGYSSAHSDVHFWYHGTIDFNSPITVDGATLSSTDRQNWWVAAEQRGTNAGFRLSLIGGGDRLSSAEPAGPGTGRISDGFNKVWDLGGGVDPNRSTLPVNGGAWPNLIRLWHNATNPVPAGSPFGYWLQQQSGSNQVSAVDFKLWLDQDANPYDGNEILVQQSLLTSTGTNSVSQSQGDVQSDVSVVLPGTYRLLASLSLGGKTRYLYAPGPVTISASLSPPWLAPLELTSNEFRLRVNAQPGQTIVTETSTNFLDWTAIATNTVTGTGFEVSDAQVAGATVRFYRAMLRP